MVSITYLKIFGCKVEPYTCSFPDLSSLMQGSSNPAHCGPPGGIPNTAINSSSLTPIMTAAASASTRMAPTSSSRVNLRLLINSQFSYFLFPLGLLLRKRMAVGDGNDIAPLTKELKVHGCLTGRAFLTFSNISIHINEHHIFRVNIPFVHLCG